MSVPVVMQRAKRTNNLADEMLSLCSVVIQNEFVRAVTFSAEHAPIDGFATLPDKTV